MSLEIALEKPPRSAYLIGCCGSGMRSLAELLLERGWRVCGSDAMADGHNADVLRARGVRLQAGRSAANLRDPALVIYSPAVPETNPERIAARKRAIPQFSYPQMLGRLMSNRTGVAIAGTHGKTTTTALLGWILQHAGRQPSVMCGGELLNTGAGGWSGAGEVFVAEACEYRGSFLNLAPRHAALLNIEPDHFDCYPDLESAVAAYAKFTSTLPSDGLLVCCADDSVVARAVAAATARVETFGLEAVADWSARDVRLLPGRTLFEVHRHRQRWVNCTLHIPGSHNVLNTLPAIALAAELGVQPNEVRRALATFRGVRRRFERMGSWRGMELVADYAHHPTAVSATLQAARAEFPARRLLCVFQPHQISRTRKLLAEFANSLTRADEVWIPPVYTARESLEDSLAASDELASATSRLGAKTRTVASLDRLVSTLETDGRPGDVVLLIGAGDIDRVRDEFSRRISRYYAS